MISAGREYGQLEFRSLLCEGLKVGIRLDGVSEPSHGLDPLIGKVNALHHYDIARRKTQLRKC
ncbi:hypothetical protein GLGCALEP_05026 [Pseudomonas sp. MM221]|nr:hypothetical protein GLGCALEP_05026 [Pseudomonas sp. MM221]